MGIVTLLFVAATLALTAGPVIAAGDGIDQQPEPRESFLLTVPVLVLAVVSVLLILRYRWHRLDRAPRRPALFPPEVCLGLMLAMFIFGQVGLRLAQTLYGAQLPGPSDPDASILMRDQVLLSLGLYGGQALIALILLWRVLQAARPADDMRSSPGRSALIGVPTLVLVWPIMAVIGWFASMVFVWLGGQEPDLVSHDTLRMLMDCSKDGWFFAMTALVAIAGPVMEEVFYRGLLQEGLRRIGAGRWLSIALASVVFAAMHWENTAPHAVVALFVLSLGFGWCYERTGRLTASIVMHMLFNGGNLVLAMLLS